MKKASDKKLMTVKEVCEHLKYSEARIWQLFGKQLQRYKHGRKTLVDFAEVMLHYNSLSTANHAKIGRRKHLSVDKAGKLHGGKGLLKPIAVPQ